MLGIRDILVRIRIRILGSVPLTNRSNADPGIPKTYGSYRSGSGSRGGFGTRVLHLHNSSKIKKNLKEVTKQYCRNQGFSYYFCLMMEESGAGSGSVLVTNGYGCGYGRPKNIRIRTGCGSKYPTLHDFCFVTSVYESSGALMP